MAFTRVQASGRNSGTNTFNIPTLGATPTAGNVLVLLLSWVANGSNNVDVDITDNTSGALTWIRAITSVNNTGSRTAIAYAFNISALGSAPTITITRQGAVTTVLQGSVEEWSGFGTHDPLAVTTRRSANNTSHATTNTTAALSELDAVVFAVVHEGLVSRTITVDADSPSWNEVWDASINGVRGEADYRIVTGGGTQTCSWTFSGNTDYTACIAGFQLNNTATIGVRVNQAVRTVASGQTAQTLRTNQVVRSAISQADTVLRVNQVVLTLVVIPTVPTAPPGGSSGRRGIYVPTRGVAGSEGGGHDARFLDLGGSIQSGPATGTSAGRIVHVMGGAGMGRALYVPPNSEGDPRDVD